MALDANDNMLLRKFVKCSPDVKCYLFKTYCSNLYCAPFWYDSTKSAMKNLKIAYSLKIKCITALGVVACTHYQTTWNINKK